MNKFFAAIFTAIITFFTGKPEAMVEVLPTPSPNTEVIESASPSAVPSIKPKPTIKPTPKPKTETAHNSNSNPTSTPAPTPTATPISTATPTPTPQASANSFTPVEKSGIFKPGSGQCSANPTGTYSFALLNYNEKDNITGVKIHVSVQGLNPNTRYILNVGSKTQLGGPSLTTDANGAADFGFDNGAYSVNYREIYSLSIDHPDKIYPSNSCLHDDLTGGEWSILRGTVG